MKRGNEKGPTVMVAGHMDEVGFMVTSITDNGMIRFQTLGGWWSQVMLAQTLKLSQITVQFQVSSDRFLHILLMMHSE